MTRAQKELGRKRDHFVWKLLSLFSRRVLAVGVVVYLYARHSFPAEYVFWTIIIFIGSTSYEDTVEKVAGAIVKKIGG